MDFRFRDRLEPKAFARRLGEVDLAEAADLLKKLIEIEGYLARNNRLKAYEDKLPLVLGELDLSLMAAIFNRLDTILLRQALFGNFRVVEYQVKLELLDRLAVHKATGLLEQLSLGLDLPGVAGRLLSDISPPRATALVTGMARLSLLRIFENVEVRDKARILERSGWARAAQIVRWMLGRGGCVRVAATANVLREVNQEIRDGILRRLGAADKDKLQVEIDRQFAEPWKLLSAREIIVPLLDVSPSVAASILLKIDAEKAVQVLKHLEPSFVAQVVAALAPGNPQIAADLLTAMHERVLGASPAGIRAQIYSLRAASVLEKLDLNQASNVEVVQRMDSAILKETLPWLDETRGRTIRGLALWKGQAPLDLRFASLHHPPRRGQGRRRSQLLGPGLKWIRIEETLQTPVGSKPMLIDLLELDPQRVRLKVCRAITEDNLVPVDRLQELFGGITTRHVRPPRQALHSLGVVRLRETVERTGALAGINGNFYFDYGHYLDCHNMGIELSQIPGLFFGDLVSWFVIDGLETDPPVFNRACLIATEEGSIHIRKVFMTDVTLSNGRRITWQGINSQRGKGRIILFNALHGFRTEKERTYTDVVIAKYQIYVIERGEGVPIPLLGFVLSIPNDQAEELLAGVQVGDEVAMGNDFPPHLGRVEQAMACGPQLVRDGQPDLDFEFEDFGEKDTSVLPLSLTRAADIFEAARSFVMLKDGRLVLGAVSGTALGDGPPRASAGMTFGELTQLAMDLGAEQAIALDGGGSSSLVVRAEDGARVLNVPTGGADVPYGEERFINTYWLVFDKKRQSS